MTHRHGNEAWVWGKCSNEEAKWSIWLAFCIIRLSTALTFWGQDQVLGCALPLNRGNEQNVWNPQVVTEACPCVEHRRIFLCSFFTGWIEPANGLLRMQQHSLKKKKRGRGRKRMQHHLVPSPPATWVGFHYLHLLWKCIIVTSSELAPVLMAFQQSSVLGKLGFARGMSRGDLHDGRSADANTHGWWWWFGYY